MICMLINFIQYDRIQEMFMLFVFKENLIKLKIANNIPMLVNLLLINNQVHSPRKMIMGDN